jgi:hypothetical protein
MPGLAATTFSRDPLPIHTDGAPCRGWRDVHNCSIRENNAVTPAAVRSIWPRIAILLVGSMSAIACVC